MPDPGKNASFKFTTILFDADDCLQSWDLNQAVNDIVYQCNGYDKHLVGTKSQTFRVSLALAATDTAKVTLFTPGTTGAFEAHPAGDTPTYIEIRATRAQVNSAPMTAPINGVIAVDVEFGLDDITLATSTS